MKWLKLKFRFFAVIDVIFAEKFVLTTYKNDVQKYSTKFDSREFKNERILASQSCRHCGSTKFSLNKDGLCYGCSCLKSD